MKLTPGHKRILRVIGDSDTPLKASKIAVLVNCSDWSIMMNARLFCEDELIRDARPFEHIGKTARVYELTDKGRAAIAE